MAGSERYDFVVIGAGMAGASAAYFLSPHGRVALLEMEAQPGYHTTGRSAALFTEAYGNETIRMLTTGGRDFLRSPPPGFAERALLSPRGALFIGRGDQLAALDALAEETARLVPDIRRLDAGEARAMVAVLDPD